MGGERWGGDGVGIGFLSRLRRRGPNRRLRLLSRWKRPPGEEAGSLIARPCFVGTGRLPADRANPRAWIPVFAGMTNRERMVETGAARPDMARKAPGP